MCLHWLVLLIAIFVQTSIAFASCVAPVSRSCLERPALFSDQREFDECRQIVETFRNETKEYLLCLKSEVSGALDRFNDAVNRFNQRVHVSNKNLRSSKTAQELMY